jgi:hypothetical protein
MTETRASRTRYNKITALLGMTEEVFKFTEDCLCNGSENPDLWHSEVAETNANNRPTKATIKQAEERTWEALQICARCPSRQSCFAEGMRDENIDSGVWGGSMSGERLLLSGKNITKSDDKNAIAFARKMRARYGYL